ncbi:hypothetical protein SADUNF_Sadunf18G0048900 [Salix dunnii]|uniref:Uncharacterized protein n=1 Tax=Salix dunnii TaxID=1413687 RepID=A0A835J400_9ROSI|nr:hypothetical protein SADUNF_Sadunf18G0048900 [Salix dunnii]
MAKVAIAEALEVLHKESNLQIVFLSPKTPATRSSRRMAPAVSARVKVEAQNEHKSVQGVYKSRSAMGLKEKERVRPMKMDGPCWVIEDVETKDESEKELQIAEKRYPVKPAKACYFFHCRILRAVTSLYRRGTQIFKFQQKTELHFLQEESYSHRYELEAYNPKQEMGSEKESRRNQSDEAKENGNGKRVVKDASNKLAESRHEIENIRSFKGVQHEECSEVVGEGYGRIGLKEKERKRNIKRELQEESLSNRYELEDYNPQQEMGSKKDLYSEVLSLDNASEINNELEKDEKSNDYEMDSYNPALEGLNGQDAYSSNNESLENQNPIVVERSEKVLPVTQELIYNNGQFTRPTEAGGPMLVGHIIGLLAFEGGST